MAKSRDEAVTASGKVLFNVLFEKATGNKLERLLDELLNDMDSVEHKVFGRGTVLKVKPAAGDQIVEINFEKVGIKKTMANFAPLTKITEEE